MDSKLDLPLHGPSLNIVKQSKSDLKKILRSKFGCDATIAGFEFEGDAGVAQPNWSGAASEKRFEITLDSGVRVSVWKADLTNFPADAVVNAANENLKHIGGLAYALSKAGGPSIQKDSDDYIKKYDILKTGNATIMDSGSLPCKKIIHAVGPRLSRFASKNEFSRAETLLSQVICKILNIAAENHLQTVAIPAISSGLFNYPLPDCAKTIVKTVKDYRGNPGHFLKEIQLVNNDEPTVREMERACRQILATYQGPTRGAKSGANQGRKFKANTKTPTSIVQFGNVCVTIKMGHIENEQTDVIVNTASKCYWKSGEISKAILRRAGREMERDLDKASPDDLVIVTKAYNLSCKEVYHTVCPDSWNNDSAQILTCAVLQCMQWASKCHSSISFPAIGTGRQGFRKSDVAMIMSNAVALFAGECPKKMDVYFVIYPSDSDTFKAFEEVMSQGQQKESHHGSTHVLEQRDEYRSGTPSSPQISLTGPSDEATHEAEKWLNHLLFQSSSQVLISNNFILHFGEQEQLQLRKIARDGIIIEESFKNGHASITVKGNSTADAVVAALQVEAMLCNVMREFIQEEERLFTKSAKEITCERITVGRSDPEFLDAKAALQHMGQHIVKVERVKNDILRQSFELRKAQLGFITARNMFQCIPAHFCDMVCQIGFNGECAPPDDPAYGEGIYFASTVKKALEVWKLPNQEFLYLVEAEVLTENSASGHRGLIVPPVSETDPEQRCNSASGGPDISVIFNACQALPTKIIICRISAV